MIEVTINGVRLIPGIDYVSDTSYVSFSQPPSFGASILISSPYGTVASVMGDGSTYRIPILDMQNHVNIMNLLNDASVYYKNPAVADVLNKLREVIALVKT